MVSAELLLQVQRRRPNLPVCLHKDVDREWVVLPKAWRLHRFALVTPSLTCVRRHNRIDINPERLPPSPLTPPERCKLSAERQREGDRWGDRHHKEGISPQRLLIALCTPARQFLLQRDQRGGPSVERLKVKKHHSPLAETAGGYVHLGCALVAL